MCVCASLIAQWVPNLEPSGGQIKIDCYCQWACNASRYEFAIQAPQVIDVGGSATRLQVVRVLFSTTTTTTRTERLMALIKGQVRSFARSPGKLRCVGGRLPPTRWHAQRCVCIAPFLYCNSSSKVLVVVVVLFAQQLTHTHAHARNYWSITTSECARCATKCNWNKRTSERQMSERLQTLRKIVT